MANPKVIEIFKGDHLYETVTINDSTLDTSTATSFTVEAEDAIFNLSLTAVAGADTDEIILSSTSVKTAFAPTGTYKARVFGNWSGSPSKKMICEVFLVFRQGFTE